MTDTADRSATRDPSIAAALRELVADGTLTEDQAARVAEHLGRTEPAGHADAPRGGRLAELAGYLGAALLLGAAGLFLLGSWDDLSDTTRVVFLGGLAAALLAGGWLVARTSGQPLRHLAGDEGSARRRLVSVLWTAGATAAAFGAGLAVDSWEVVAAAAVGVLVAAVAYALVPGVVGQLGLWAGSITLVMGLVGELGDEPDPSWYAAALVLLGAAWVTVAMTGTVRALEVGLACGVAIGLFGAQLPVLGGDDEWVGYVLTAAVAVAGFLGYLATRSWSVLAGGVLATTLVVPEALHDWTEGSLSAAGSMLVAGLTLLAASAVGLRLRHEVR